MDTDKSKASTSAANIETCGWKSSEFRINVVNKLMNAAIESSPEEWKDKTSELLELANTFEENIFKSALDEGDYTAIVSREVALLQKDLSQSSSHSHLPLNSSGPNESLSASGAREGASNLDWKELLFQRIQRMKSLYFSKLSTVNHYVVSILNQHDSGSQYMMPDEIKKHKFLKRLLDEVFVHLNVTQSHIDRDFKLRLDKLENHIKMITGQEAAEQTVQQLEKESGGIPFC